MYDQNYKNMTQVVKRFIVNNAGESLCCPSSGWVLTCNQSGTPPSGLLGSPHQPLSPTFFDQMDRMDCADGRACSSSKIYWVERCAYSRVCVIEGREYESQSRGPPCLLVPPLSLNTTTDVQRRPPLLWFSLSVLPVLYAMCDTLCSKCIPSNMSAPTEQSVAVSCLVSTSELNNIAMPVLQIYGKAEVAPVCCCLFIQAVRVMAPACICMQRIIISPRLLLTTPFLTPKDTLCFIHISQAEHIQLGPGQARPTFTFSPNEWKCEKLNFFLSYSTEPAW